MVKETGKDNVKKTGKTGYQPDHEGTVKHITRPRLSDLKRVKKGGKA